MADNVLRHHKKTSKESIPAGVGIFESTFITSDDYNNQVDPLAVKSNVANKPGSSIPSIFGRMMFFNTALKNSKIRLSKAETPSIYEKTVSEWLDLFELIFNQSYKLEFIRWNVTEQINALKKFHHDLLGEVFENQTTKFFDKHVQSIYIIKERESGKVIGATSPYTIVFTSPNWKTTRPIRLLLNRNREFRLFIYRLADVMKSNGDLTRDIKVQSTITGNIIDKPNPAYQLVKNFLDYAERNQSNDDINKTEIHIATASTSGNSCFDILSTYYEEVESIVGGTLTTIPVENLNVMSYDHGKLTTRTIGTLKLYQRPMKQIVSDLFIDGDVEEFQFNGETLPLILPDETGYSHLFYYDGQTWEDSFVKFPQYENLSETIRELPNCEAYRHNYLSSIDFLEDQLVSIPYRMDSEKFKGVINTTNRAYFLPIKPKLLKYLKVETILKNLKVKIDEDAKTIEVAVGVPVRNNDNSKKDIVYFKKIYDLNKDVATVTKRDPMEQPISIGVAPFIRFPGKENSHHNRHNIYLQYPSDKRIVDNISVDFLTEGTDMSLAESDMEATERDGERAKVKSRIYKLKGTTFDALRVKLDDAAGIIIPAFDTPTLGVEQYYYAIDFGTTNTHIAFISGTMLNAQSFDHKELHDMAVYLAEKPNVDKFLQNHTPAQLQNVLQRLYGPRGIGFIQEQARAFFPNFEQDDYKFPIRTVSYEEIGVSDNLFGKFSIGFRYPKESFANPKYRTSLKWDLTQPKVTEAQIRAQMFFEELLEIVRIHWLSLGGADLSNTPVIMLTYPLAMSSTAQLKRIWANAYAKVFGVKPLEASNKIKELAESLAPAQSLITLGVPVVNAILNVDIGGGTTDIQYYRKEGTKIVAKYNSVLFAGDDLWGCGHENISGNQLRDITDNVFTDFANDYMENMRLKIGLEEIDYNQINLKGKEKINLLLRDENSQFATLVQQTEEGNSVARKVIVLHYAAILYHIANWILSDSDMEQQFPATLNFTGYGSKYIEIIFGPDDKERLTDFTKALFEAFGVKNIPDDFKVIFSNNPKAATAEGAAIFARIGTKNIPLRSTNHYGAENIDHKAPLKLSQAEALRPEVEKYFDKYIKAVRKVVESDINLKVPSFSDKEINGLRKKAITGYKEIVTDKLGDDPSGQARVSDSLFFWMLKDALYEFHKY